MGSHKKGTAGDKLGICVALQSPEVPVKVVCEHVHVSMTPGVGARSLTAQSYQTPAGGMRGAADIQGPLAVCKTLAFGNGLFPAT